MDSRGTKDQELEPVLVRAWTVEEQKIDSWSLG